MKGDFICIISCICKPPNSSRYVRISCKANVFSVFKNRRPNIFDFFSVSLVSVTFVQNLCRSFHLFSSEVPHFHAFSFIFCFNATRVQNDAFVSLRAVRRTCKCHRGFLVEFASSYYPVWSLNSSFYFVLCFPPFPRSRQFLTRVKRTMDVVPVHICVSSITTAQPPVPVHTSWSFPPTNSPALVSGNTFYISSFFRLHQRPYRSLL